MSKKKNTEEKKEEKTETNSEKNSESIHRCNAAGYLEGRGLEPGCVSGGTAVSAQ